jgi:hypothetical protein
MLFFHQPEDTMAKRKKRSRRKSGLEVSAENIGSALGHVAARLDAWKVQRQEIGAELQRVMSKAQGMLSDLSPEIRRAVRIGRKQGMKMSKAANATLRRARAKMSSSPKKRTATKKNAQSKKRAPKKK